MQNTNWLRFSFLGALIVAGGAAGIVACGGDDDPADPGADGGGSSSSSSGDVTSSSGGSSGVTSSSSGGSSGEPPPPPAALAVVHGWNEGGPVKICYATTPQGQPAPEVGQAIAPLSPLPGGDTPLVPGSGGILPSTGTDLATVNIRPYLIKAAALAARPADQCDALLSGANKLPDTDYFALEPITAGTLQPNTTFVLVAHEGATEGVPAATPFKLDTDTAVAADKLAVQFINGSKYFAGATPFLDRAAADEPADAGDDAGDAGPADEDGPVVGVGRKGTYIAGEARTAPLAAVSALHETALFGDGASDDTTTALGVVVDVPAAVQLLNRTSPVVGDLVAVQTWSAISDPNSTQGTGADSLYYKAGHAFTFILVGDPQAPAPSGDPNSQEYKLAALKRPHWLVFPNKPIVPGL